MNPKQIILVLMYSLVSGCSVSGYTLLEDFSEPAIKKTDLGNNPEYIGFLNRPARLKPLTGIPWKLKKYDGGGYHVELYTKYSNKEIVCDLTEANVTILEVYNDDVNGGVFYGATVICEGITYYAPSSSWSDALKDSLEFRVAEH